MSNHSDKSPHAYGTAFDPDTSDLVSENVNDAIIEIDNKVNTSASPGFSFGRDGRVNENTWLMVTGRVPSNRSGRWVYINNAVIKKVFVGVEDIDTFDVAVYYHDGDEINLTFIGSITVTAARGGKFDVNWAVPTDKQLAIRVENGSAKNCIVGLELSGIN